MHTYQTGQNNRETYKFFFCCGNPIEIKVGTTGIDDIAVTKELIALLHELDDAAVRAGWREEGKHPTVYYGTPEKLECYISDGGSSALADWSTNPERLLFPEDDPAPWIIRLLDRLPGAIELLQPQQQWLVDMVYYDRLKNCEIARIEGVTEAAIRDRLRKICARLRRILSE